MKTIRKAILTAVSIGSLYSSAFSSPNSDTKQLEGELQHLAAMAKRCGHSQIMEPTIDGKIEERYVGYILQGGHEKRGKERFLLQFGYDDSGPEKKDDGVIGPLDSFELRKWEHDINRRVLTHIRGGDKAHLTKEGKLVFCNLGQRPVEELVAEMRDYAQRLMKEYSHCSPNNK